MPASRLKAPLYSLVSGPKTAAALTVGEGFLAQKQPTQLNYSVAELLQKECVRVVQEKIRARQMELQDLLKTSETCPGFVRVHC